MTGILRNPATWQTVVLLLLATVWLAGFPLVRAALPVVVGLALV
jgi:hypothetical protein